MICEHCGSLIADGAKFCTECGTRIAAPESTASDVILPDIPEVILPDIPDIPDVILPTAPVIPDVSQSVTRSGAEPEPEDDAAEPYRHGSAPEPDDAPSPAASAWSVPTPAAAPYAPAPAAPTYRPAPEASSGGWSIPGGAPATAPVRTEPAAKKPFYTRWWFWLIVVVGVGLIALVIAAAVFAAKLEKAVSEAESPEALVQNILEEAGLSEEEIAGLDFSDLEIPDIDIPELTGLPESAEGAFPLDADDKYTPLDVFAAMIDEELTDMRLEHNVTVDGDDQLHVDVWTDGVDELAEAAYNGDEASLREWNALAENIRLLSESYRADLRDGGQRSSSCTVSLLDDLDNDLAVVVAVDGELILDLVNGIDEYGLMED